jgi:SAM-dependent methyltransferase
MDASHLKKTGGLMGDQAALYMAAPRGAARHIAQRLAGKVVLELCCGVGGITMELARSCKRVCSVDINAGRVAGSKLNMPRSAVNNVKWIVGDGLNEKNFMKVRPEVVLADPDWSPEHVRDKKHHTEDISRMRPPADRIHALAAAHADSNLAMRMPGCVNKDMLRDLGPCEIEAIFLDDRTYPSFYFVYYGSLMRVSGETEQRLRSF